LHAFYVGKKYAQATAASRPEVCKWCRICCRFVGTNGRKKSAKFEGTFGARAAALNRRFPLGFLVPVLVPVGAGFLCD